MKKVPFSIEKFYENLFKKNFAISSILTVKQGSILKDLKSNQYSDLEKIPVKRQQSITIIPAPSFDEDTISITGLRKSIKKS